MELVYLWVEDYKNIHKQGFNFSPRFRCHYDEDKNELTIDKNDDYIKIFFGENINVTAIVGKNGSGKSTLLKILEDKYNKELKRLVLYREEDKYYCEYNNISSNIASNIDITFIDASNFNKKHFYPEIIRIAHNEKIGEESLSHYYFGIYSGLFGGWDIKRRNSYNLLEARFFVPRYINIAIEYFAIFNELKYMYMFDTLRLILKSNSTEYLRKWLDDEVSNFRDFGRIKHYYNGKFCVYEKSKHTLSLIEQETQKRRIPIMEAEINLYNKEREKIVSILEEIEKIHRSQTSDNSIERHNKYMEFDLAILIAFIEYYLKNTEPCETCQIVSDSLIEIKKNLSIHKYRIRIDKGYILNFFENLKKQNFAFEKDDLLSIDDIVNSIKYLQNFNVNYFDTDGNPYIDIPINKKIKDNLLQIRIMQKIFFDHEFDCGNEDYLRVFEYDLINKKIGSSYETISDGEKNFINFTIDIIYFLQTLKQDNFTPKKEKLAIFLSDEPDNALHPIWKKRVVASVMEIFKSYLDMPNISVHFIYTTHSPFLLSDIPKQNIIFLDTDENGNCKVVDGLNEKKETFGANIHTLLSDSFFMEDGLMGEFAKNKIQEIMDFLNDKKAIENISTKEEQIKQIIESIGEPFLKQKLLDMYYKKFKDKALKKARKDKLLAEKERIESELKKYD